LKSSSVFNRARATRSDIATLHEAGEIGHFVHFYEDDRFALENIGRLAGKRMAAGDSGVFVATKPHLEIIEQHLETSGLDLHWLRAQGRCVTHDADATLSRFMEDGWPNRDKFLDLVGGIVGQAIERSPNRSVLVFGEMVARLCAANNSSAAIALERLWNVLSTRFEFALWCAYPLSSFQDGAEANAWVQICSEHSLVVPAESPL
jgi:MEDS: MEthanogen/methylotroph, DcmR Sensory domain